MKPVKLKFKGINSFSEETEIDFETLTRNGIFGIFGDTGSGKSTILDCINFALYGKVERSREKIDIINYRSESAEVKFEFDVVFEGKRRRYCVERSIKKKSGVHKALLYEDKKCIADNASAVVKKITDILGVDADDFRKCIALPQGEFSQFVKSQPSERIALIERLFSLSKYGDRLKERLKAREGQAELNYSALFAKVETYSDVSKEKIKELKQQIDGFKKQIKTLSEESAKAEKEYLKLKVLGEKRSELDNIVEKLSEIENIKPQMEELRAGLKAASVCKSITQNHNEIVAKRQSLSTAEKLLLKITDDISAENENLSALNSRLNCGNFDDEITKCIELSAKYSACGGMPEKLEKLNNELDKKRAEYRVNEELYKQLKGELERAESGLAAAEKKLANCEAENLEQIIDVHFKGAVLKEEYVYSLDYFSGLKGQIKFHNDGSELYKFIESELKQRIDIYKDRVFQVKDFNIEKARNLINNYQTAGETREKSANELNDCKVKLKEAQTALLACEKDMQIIRRDGEELRKQADDIKAEVEKIFGGACAMVSAEKENSQRLATLKRQKAQLMVDIEAKQKMLAEFTARKAAVQAEIKTTVADIDRLSINLDDLLKKSGYESVDKCRSLTEKFSKYPDAEKELEEYDSKIISLSARRKELENTPGLADFSLEKLYACEMRKNSVKDKLSFVRESCAVDEADLKKSEKRLGELDLLLKDLSAAEKERNIISQLKDLTKGNKFMEYIANEYLCDIASLASSTLLNLTDGRYFLSYKDNFYAGDNYNCGNLRGVNTLSGGETFLVSLSLALALSQTICASLKSIEFFFLDEGFGTLDSTLVDTVMGALEKLKGSHFTIGVISHVEELKHRIDSKITVNKATESHGSTVQISC